MWKVGFLFGLCATAKFQTANGLCMDGHRPHPFEYGDCEFVVGERCEQRAIWAFGNGDVLGFGVQMEAMEEGNDDHQRSAFFGVFHADWHNLRRSIPVAKRCGGAVPVSYIGSPTRGQSQRVFC